MQTLEQIAQEKQHNLERLSALSKTAEWASVEMLLDDMLEVYRTELETVKHDEYQITQGKVAILRELRRFFLSVDELLSLSKQDNRS